MGFAASGEIEELDQTEVFFLLEQGAGVHLKIGRDDDFAENLADRFGKRLIDRSIANDDAAEGRLLIGRKRFFPRFAQIGIAADAARVGVLQNGYRRLREFGDQVCSRADVENVVKRQLFAMQFFEMPIEIAVERSGLVRILAVTQTRDQRQRDRKRRVRLLLPDSENSLSRDRNPTF